MGEPFAARRDPLDGGRAVPGAALAHEGTPGRPITIDVLAANCGPVPAPLMAATLNAYVEPFVSPVTVSVVAVELNV